MSRAGDLAAALGLRRTGRDWRGPCPVHGGSSFTLAERGGVPVWTCWSGCDRGAILQELRARGLWPQADRQGLTAEEKHVWASARREAEALAALRRNLISRCRERRNLCWDAGSGAKRWLKRNATAQWDEQTRYALKWADEGERRGDAWEERLRTVESAGAAELRELARGGAA